VVGLRRDRIVNSIHNELNAMTTKVQLPGSDLGYFSSGSGSRAVVFVHGFLDGAAVWDAVASRLSVPKPTVTRLVQALEAQLRVRLIRFRATRPADE
jgi:pimeloyl-ACP methyl ester carboxylesterase